MRVLWSAALAATMVLAAAGCKEGGGNEPVAVEKGATASKDKADKAGEKGGGDKKAKKPDPGMFVSEEGGFKAWMKRRPTKGVTPTPTEAGTLDMHTFTTELATSAMVASYSDMPKDVLTERSEAYIKRNLINGVLGAYKGAKLVGKVEHFEHKGRPAATFALSGTLPGVGAFNAKVLAVWAGPRVYQALGLWAGTSPKVPADIDKFLKSFELTDKAPTEKLSELTVKPFKKYTAEDGSFSVEAPGEAKVEHRDVPQAGVTMKVHSYSWSEGMYGMLAMTVLELPAEVAKVFDAKAAMAKARQEFEQRFGAKNVKEESLEGGKVLKLTGDTAEGTDKIVLRAYYEWKAPRLYQAVARWGELQDDKRLAKFFDTLTIGADAVKAGADDAKKGDADDAKKGDEGDAKKSDEGDAKAEPAK